MGFRMSTTNSHPYYKSIPIRHTHYVHEFLKQYFTITPIFFSEIISIFHPSFLYVSLMFLCPFFSFFYFLELFFTISKCQTKLFTSLKQSDFIFFLSLFVVFSQERILIALTFIIFPCIICVLSFLCLAHVTYDFIVGWHADHTFL